MDSSIPRTNGAYDYRIAYTDQEGLDYGYYDPFCVIAQETLDIIHLEFPQTKEEWTFDAVFSKLEDKYKCIIDIETPEGMIPMLCITQEGHEIVHRDICKVPNDFPSMSYLQSSDIKFNVIAGTSYLANWRIFPFDERKPWNYQHEIRTIENKNKERLFVLKDILDALNFEEGSEAIMLERLNETEKIFIPVDSPLDETMWCVTHDGVQSAVDVLKEIFDTLRMVPVKPSKMIIHNVHRDKSRVLSSVIEWMNYRHQMLPYTAKEPVKKAEMRIELALEKSLVAKGIKVQRQVRCEAGIADVVTLDTIYEIKDVLTESKLQKAVAQVIAYRACINPSAKVAVVGKRHKKPISTKFAKHLNVEIIYWDESSQVENTSTD